MNRLSRQWYHYRYKVDVEERSPLFPRPIVNQTKLTHGYIYVHFSKRRNRKKCRIQNHIQASNPFGFFSFSPSLQQMKILTCQRSMEPGKGKDGSSDTMLRVDGWCVPSSPQGNHLACVTSLSFTPSFIYTCEGLLEERRNINYPVERFCEHLQSEAKEVTFRGLPAYILLWFLIFISCILMSE